jgi:hypothetical protein
MAQISRIVLDRLQNRRSVVANDDAFCLAEGGNMRQLGLHS